MPKLNDYAKMVLSITSSGKFPKDSIEQQILGAYNGLSSLSNAVMKKDLEDIEKRFGGMVINLLSIANTLKLDPEKVVSRRVKEIELCHGLCKRSK